MTNEEGQEYYSESMPLKVEKIGGDKDHIAAVLAYHGIDFAKQLEKRREEIDVRDAPTTYKEASDELVSYQATRICDLELQVKKTMTHRELLVQAIVALEPFDNEVGNFNHPHDGALYIATMDDKHKGSLAAFTLGDLVKARRVREKLKAAL